MSILLDTNAYSAFFSGREEITEIVRRATKVCLSVFVVGELLYGFRLGTRSERNRRDLEAFLDAPRVVFLPATVVTAERFARVAEQLRASGRPLPTNDVWIAAHAIEAGAELVSYDRHFGDVAGLAWVDPGPSG